MGGRGRPMEDLPTRRSWDKVTETVDEQYWPDSNDVIDPSKYFNDTNLPVNVSLTNWKQDVDKMGIWNEVGLYMEDSSINDKMKNGTLTPEEQKFVNQLNMFTQTSWLRQGQVVYSGLNEKSLQLFDKPTGETVQPNSFVSVSPDPVYAGGYTLGTEAKAMLKIVPSDKLANGVHIGKTYYQDSTGTEGIFSSRFKYKIGKKYYRKVSGQRVKIIEVVVSE